ncbi:MAG: succinate dehydrogenase assembly factor 2 [Mariprofundaceae bacterium]|nr:succinate dehydrogenase assembly factor 2 [Mariprofundaceae bacterium]
MSDADAHMRRLQYRLQRQGMLELDAWLAPLQQAIKNNDAATTMAIEKLLLCEAPELQAMQAGTLPIPEELKPWLEK